jgi:hypothetical protein
MQPHGKARLSAVFSGTALLALIAVWGALRQLRLGQSFVLTVSSTSQEAASTTCGGCLHVASAGCQHPAACVHVFEFCGAAAAAAGDVRSASQQPAPACAQDHNGISPPGLERRGGPGDGDTLPEGSRWGADHPPAAKRCSQPAQGAAAAGAQLSARAQAPHSRARMPPHMRAGLRCWLW